MIIDPVQLTQALVRRPSVTPADAGAMDVLCQALDGLGFTITQLPFGGEGRPVIENIYARRGTARPHLVFAGHTDVVPAGAPEMWTRGPFDAALDQGTLYGRGTVDMKGAIAAFIAATSRFIAQHPDHDGSIGFLITGDEEGPSVDGTVRVVDWLLERNEKIDHCLVGEPTNPDAIGDMIKIGRRGSLNGVLTVAGRQGHVAYPHRADNPIPTLIKILDRITSIPLDEGTAHFDPSNLEVTSIDVGNPTTNVIPAQAQARFNIRFNDLHTKASLDAWLHAHCDAVTEQGVALETVQSGVAFVTQPDRFTEVLSHAIESVTGQAPALSTSGGTSDARFIVRACPVVEFGLVGRTMHQVDEHVAVDDLMQLTHIYETLLHRYFEAS